ncbi:hypothetical protein PN466_10695 [Roseofilum reptotaenium CS-1145]|nr:hypothetical protein [Roseofilum reptotaenium CS-1145]
MKYIDLPKQQSQTQTLSNNQMISSPCNAVVREFATQKLSCNGVVREFATQKLSCNGVV